MAQLLNGFLHVFLRTARILQNACGSGVDAEQSKQDGLDADELVATLLGRLLCAHEYIITIVREIRLSALHTWQVLDLLCDKQFYLLGVDAKFLEDEGTHVLRLLQYALENMYRFDDLLAVLLSDVHCLLHSLLGLDSEFV